MKLSLPAKISLFSFVITLIWVIGVAWMAYVESDQLLQKEAVHSLFSTMGKDLLIIEQQAKRVKSDVVFLAQSDAVRSFANCTKGQQICLSEHHLNHIEQLFSTVLSRREMYYQVRLIGVDDGGREVVRVARLQEGPKVIPHDLLQQKGERGYFKNSIQLKPGELYFSDITLNREHGKITQPPQPMLRVSAAIYSDSGVLRGILLINADFDVFTESLADNPNVFITNKQGDYLIHSDENKAMAFEYQRQSRVQDDYALSQQTLNGSFENKNTIINEYLFDKQGEILLAGKIYLDPLHKDHYLNVGAVVELKTLRQESIGLRDKMLLLTLMLAVLLGFVTYVFARYVTRPIREMIDAAVDIGHGIDDVEIPAKTHDEIGDLGASLQQMLVKMHEERSRTESLNVALEVKVSKRTAELARLAGRLEAQNTELERAVLNAEQAASAKGQFLATMSHEIRTPLNGILGLTELVLASKMYPEQRRRVEIVYTSGQALLTILNDILDFSKIEAGHMEIKKAEFNPNKVIEGVSELFASQANANEAVLELIIRGMPVMPMLFLGDADRLHQVMMNLLSNALKFTEQGEVVLAVDVVSENDLSAVLCFEVRDSGRGISDADQARLFDEFTQADGTDSRKHGGTGLGLAIVKKLVALMGGQIQVESEIGKGSRFFFELELEKASALEDHPDEYRDTFSQWNALVVDDNASNRSMLQDALVDWGMQCSTCACGNTALQSLRDMAAKEQAYDVIFIDHQMQGMDGLNLARLIKEDVKLVDLKVIMTTSLDMSFDQKLRDKYALDGFMRKPIYVHSLFETTLSVMGARLRQQKQLHREPIRSRHERILLAEDNAVNQQVVVGLLKNQGFEHVDVANDGVQALELFAQHDYELVLMDIQMPELDGIAATREIRALELLSDQAPVPIIALTAHALDEDKQRTHDAGMNDHLTKPLTGKSLASILERWLPVGAIIPLDHGDDGTDEMTDVVIEEAVEDAEAVDVEATALAVLDEAGLRQLHADMGFGLAMILDTYVEELPAQVESLEAAIKDENGDEIRRIGHRLKGSSRSVRADALGDACYQLEQMGQQQDITAARACLTLLKSQVEQVIDAFSADWLDEIR